MVRDQLLDSVPKKYHPLTYLGKIEEIKPGEFSPTALEQRPEQLLVLYEAARMRAVFHFESYPEISATYAAWLYYRRLPERIAELIKSPSDIKGDSTHKVYQDIGPKVSKIVYSSNRGNCLNPRTRHLP